jgi:hypothetical protein
MNLLVHSSLCALEDVSRDIPRYRIAKFMISLFNFINHCQHSFQSSCTNSPVRRICEFLFLLIHVSSLRHFNFCQSVGCEMTPHYGFNLNFPDYLWDWTVLHVYWPIGFSPLWVAYSLILHIFFIWIFFLLIWS